VLFREFSNIESLEVDGLEVLEPASAAGATAADKEDDSSDDGDDYDSEEERFFAAMNKRKAASL
jgi:hypothetical protein